QQIVGRERRECVSQLVWCGEGCFDSPRQLRRSTLHSSHQVRSGAQMKNLFRSSWIAFVICSAVFLCAVSLRAQQTTRRPPGQKSQPPVTKTRFDLGNSALRIPLEIDNNIILLRVNVNGSKPLKFIFDTGASISCISSKRAAELGLKDR